MFTDIVTVQSTRVWKALEHSLAGLALLVLHRLPRVGEEGGLGHKLATAEKTFEASGFGNDEKSDFPPRLDHQAEQW